MATTVHSNLTGTDIHVPYAWSYADQTTREAAGGFVSGDVGKLALQEDDNSLWMLTATTPTWVQVSVQGGAGLLAANNLSDVGSASTSRTNLGVADATTTALGRLKSPWLFTQTADQTIANDTTETTLFGTGVGTLTLPANCLTAGRSIRITLMGYWSNNTANVNTIRVNFAGNRAIDMANKFGGMTFIDRVWRVDALLTCRTTGASGSIVGQAVFMYPIENGTADAAYGFGKQGDSGFTADTTGTLALDVTWQWDAADAGNTITCTNATVELLN